MKLSDKTIENDIWSLSLDEEEKTFITLSKNQKIKFRFVFESRNDTKIKTLETCLRTIVPNNTVYSQKLPFLSKLWLSILTFSLIKNDRKIYLEWQNNSENDLCQIIDESNLYIATSGSVQNGHLYFYRGMIRKTISKSILQKSTEKHTFSHVAFPFGHIDLFINGLARI